MSPHKVFASLLVAASLAMAGDGSWQKAADVDGIAVYTRSVSGSEVKEVKAIGTIDAPPARVWRAIGDYENYKHFMPYTKESRIVRKEENVVYFYSFLEFFWPIGSRAYTLKITHDATQAREGVYRSSWDLAKKHVVKPKEAAVTTPVNKGNWHLAPVAGKTRATYYLFTDPGGKIPIALVNRANTRTVPDIIRAVRKRVKAKRR